MLYYQHLPRRADRYNRVDRGAEIQKISGAGLDVYEEEGEYFFEDFSNDIVEDDELARLLGFPNVIVSSHQGFFTREAMQAIAIVTVENLHNYEQQTPLKNEIVYKQQ